MKVKLKTSFSLIELSIYIVVAGLLTGVVLSVNTITENAKVQKTIEQFIYYDNAITEFVRRYGQFPGAMTIKRCKTFPEFSDYCIASPQAANSSSNNFTNNITCFNDLTYAQARKPLHLANNSLSSYIQFFNYGRFLRSSNIVNSSSVRKGINEPLETTNLDWFYNKQNDPSYYLPKVEGNDDTFMFYFYQTSNPGFLGVRSCNNSFSIYSFSDPLPNLSNQCNFNNYDHVLIAFATIYNRSNTNAYSPNTAKKIDIKMDDGLPRNGRIVGFGHILGHCDGNKDKYYSNSTASINNNKKINYLNSNSLSNGCQLVYQSQINISKLLY